MKPVYPIVLALIMPAALQAQGNNAEIRKGSQFYRQGRYDAAQQAFDKVLNADPKNPLASYNLGNTQFRSNKPEDAAKTFENAIDNSSAKEKDLKEKAWYNKGVAMIKQQNLQESITAWKEALKLNPEDGEARDNLQKALLQQKQQQNKEQKQQQQQPKKQEQQKEQQSKLSKQQVDQLLKALQQKEKDIQQRMQQKNASPNKPDKDW